MQNKIIIEGLRLYGFHGAMPQEHKVGAYYTIDIEVETDFSSAMGTDQLNGTISYADILQTIREEMNIPSQTVEHVAGRMARTVLAEHHAAESVRIKMMKENPPMGAECQGAGVEITIKR